ncbi:MAG: S41 family peptidase [Bacteroidia bacterium]
MRTSWLWILFSVLILHNSLAQQPTLPVNQFEVKFKLSDLQSDFSLLKNALLEAHPGLSTFHDSVFFRKNYDSLRLAFKDGESETGFYKAVTALVAGIGCGHSSCFPSRTYIQTFESSDALFFPFPITILKERIYIIGPRAKGQGIEPGSELLEINNISAQEVLQKMLCHIPGDGYSAALKYHIMETDFATHYAELIGRPDSFHLKWRAPGGEKETINTFSASPKKRPPSRHNKSHADMYLLPPPLNFELTKDKIGILTIHSFDKKDIHKRGQRYKSFLRHSFNALNEQGANDLVIDLRNNEGGDDDFGWYLYSYLCDTTFQYYQRIEVASDKRFTFLPYCSNRMVCRMLRHLIKKDNTGKNLFRYGGDTKRLYPQYHPFRGQVFVLINGGSFSTTAEFSAIAQYNKKALFIGEESGGDYSGDNSGLITMLTLPHTGIRVKIPLFRYVLAVDPNHPKGRGVIPDQIIPRNINDVIKGVDTQKEYIVEYIRKKNCKGCGR